MKIALINAHLSRNAGGVYEVLIALLRAQMRQTTLETHLFGIDDQADFPSDVKEKITALPSRGLRAFGYTPGLEQGVRNFQPDVVHSHGIWMFNSLVALRQRRYGARTIISPHGMLDPWIRRRARWKKIPIELWFENRNLRQADCIHALNMMELNAIRSAGFTNPVAVIPNGIELPPNVHGDPPWKGLIPSDAKVLLFLGRLHPKKGLEQLLEAVSLFNPSMAKWHLAIAGWGDDHYLSQLRDRTQNLGIDERVHFIGPLFDEAKHDAYSHADSFVLPSWSEGLPVAVLEALSYRIPVFMTDECNLPEAFLSRSAVKISHDPAEIAKTLAAQASYPLTDIANAGFRLVEGKYQWSGVAQKFHAVYAWILGRGEKPDMVHEINS
jgi:poly(glycerol-phosphate) alpha-glucosyltransferase